jgi:hypothetical protein
MLGTWDTLQRSSNIIETLKTAKTMKTTTTTYGADGKKVNVFIPEKEDMNDEINPDFIFQSTATELLVKAVRGEIDIHELAWQELRSRGLDHNGKWIGFDK